MTKKIMPLATVIFVLLFFLNGSSLYLFSFANQEPVEKENKQDKEKENRKKTMDDLFEMSFEDLMKVKIITAAKTPEKIGDIPASVVIVTRNDIERYGYETLAEILQNIPGLYAIDDYSFQGANFGIRGFWSGIPNDNLMILVNGIQQVYDPSSNYPLGNCPVPVEAIDRIDVVRGPMSVVYGSGAFFGVINIITNSHVEDTPADPVSLVSLAMGSQKTKKFALRLENNAGKFRYVINASLYDTYGINEALSDMMRNPAALTWYNLAPDHRTGGQLEVTRKYFSFSGQFKNLQVDFSLARSDQESYFIIPSFSQGNQNRLDSLRLGLAYRKKFSDALNVHLKMNYSHILDFFDMDFLSEDFYGIQQVASDAYEVELNSTYTPSSKLSVTSGVYFRAVANANDKFNLPSFGADALKNNEFFLTPGKAIVTRSVFSQLVYKPWTRIQFIAGLRLEQMPKYDINGITGGGTPSVLYKKGSFIEDKVEVIPRVAMIFAVNNRNILKLLYGKAINRSSFTQNRLNLMSGADSLEPEDIQTLELNYIAAFSNAMTLNASIFYNQLNRLITRVVSFNSQTGQYDSHSANAGKLQTTGLEMNLEYKPIRHLFINLRSTFQKTGDKSPLPGAPEEVAYSPSFLAYIKVAYEGKNVIAALNGIYVDAMETFWDQTLNQTGDRIGDRVPGYFNLNANIRILDLFKEGFYLNFKVENLLNREIRYPTFTNTPWADRGTIGKRRSWLLSLGYQF